MEIQLDTSRGDRVSGHVRRSEAVGARIPKLNPDYDASFYEADQDYAKRQMWGAFEGSRPLEADEK